MIFPKIPLYYNESVSRFQLLFPGCTFQIFPCILKETCHDHYNDQADRKSGYDRHRLQTVDRIFRKDQRDREKNEQNRPKCTYTFIRLLIYFQFLIRIRGNYHCQCIKCCRIKSDHCNNKNQQSHFRKRQCVEICWDKP